MTASGQAFVGHSLVIDRDDIGTVFLYFVSIKILLGTALLNDSSGFFFTFHLLKN
jgi:hypothetical protein